MKNNTHISTNFMNKFKEGDIVCLVFDKNKRFMVVNNKSLTTDKVIAVAYFSDFHGEIKLGRIPEEYLILVTPQ